MELSNVELSGVFYEKVLVQEEFEIGSSYWAFYCTMKKAYVKDRSANTVVKFAKNWHSPKLSTHSR